MYPRYTKCVWTGLAWVEDVNFVGEKGMVTLAQGTLHVQRCSTDGRRRRGCTALMQLQVYMLQNGVQISKLMLMLMLTSQLCLQFACV